MSHFLCSNRRARFQLFGDTVNTASRIETTGVKNKIHASAETANRLKRAGKTHWVTARETEVEIKGKGLVQTYWINLEKNAHSAAKATSESSGSENASVHHLDANDYIVDSPAFESHCLSPQEYRLVQWNADVLAGILKQIVASRQAAAALPGSDIQVTQHEAATQKSELTPRQEIAEVVNLPRYNDQIAAKQKNPDNIALDEVVTKELFCYVTAIASMYKGKPSWIAG
jgi:Adenylate and Guanylate cyclase catalytic domain